MDQAEEQRRRLAALVRLEPVVGDDGPGTLVCCDGCVRR
jgi:hypothetical protein